MGKLKHKSFLKTGQEDAVTINLFYKGVTKMKGSFFPEMYYGN